MIGNQIKRAREGTREMEREKGESQRDTHIQKEGGSLHKGSRPNFALFIVIKAEFSIFGLSFSIF